VRAGDGIFTERQRGCCRKSQESQKQREEKDALRRAIADRERCALEVCRIAVRTTSGELPLLTAV
jgi:hypothetical protein